MGAKSSRNGRGAVYIYRESNDDWNRVDTLDPDVDQGQVGNFGWDVALEDSSHTLLVGAPHEGGRGALFIYKREDANRWLQAGTEVAPGNLNNGDEFGFSVAIEKQVAVAGARYASSERERAGAVFIYEIPPADEDAILKQRLDSPEGPIRNAEYGYSVAIRDGRLIVGEPDPEDEGAVYLYYRGADEESLWELTDEVFTQNSSGIRYGTSVAVTENALMVGAPRNDADGDNSGSVFAYEVVIESEQAISQITPAIRSPAKHTVNSVSLPGKRYVRIDHI